VPVQPADSPDGLKGAAADCVNPATDPGDHHVVHAIWQRPSRVAPGLVPRDSKIWRHRVRRGFLVATNAFKRMVPWALRIEYPGQEVYMRYVYISLIVLVSAIVLVFTLQNLPTVTVHFVTLRLTLPLSVLVTMLETFRMSMNSVDQDAAAGLWDECDPPCLSLFQPTHRDHPDNQQDPIRFKNLVKALEESLRQQV
jgi:uncharacterized integral membrane protein